MLSLVSIPRMHFTLSLLIYNQVVKVSHDGGRNWTTDSNLTNEVTNAGRLLLYDGDSSHMQVTQISFDPYDSERIVVGTRDAGIIISKNGGTRGLPRPVLSK